MRRCLESLRTQAYDSMEVVVVDDGSPNQEELLPVYDAYAGSQFRVFLFASNRGKRDAQRLGFDVARGEVVVTIDSDTVLSSPQEIARLVRRFSDERVGAVTGNVAVKNFRDNLLTKLVGYRYWSAFNQERAAQSVFHVVMCCSGPFAAYRRSILDQVKDRYTSQSFAGRRCTFGDDRHLTNLVLEAGYGVVFDGRATAVTAAPTRLSSFLRQQVRWNKSFYRELVWTLRFAHRKHPYLLFDLTFQTLLPVMLFVAVIPVVGEAVAGQPGAMLHYLAVVAGVGALRATYGLWRTRTAGFALFAIYGFLHMLVLKPLSLYALATLLRTHWGTRGGAEGPGLHDRVFERLAEPPPQLIRLLASGRYSVSADAVATAMVQKQSTAAVATGPLVSSRAQPALELSPA